MLRSDSDDPNCTKSMTDSEAPSRLMPNSDIADPRRAKLRNDSEAPRWR